MSIVKNFIPIVATGGTINDVEINGVNHRVHTFNTNGTFSVTNLGSKNEVEVIAWGAGGGSAGSGFVELGGKGGDGALSKSILNVIQTSYPITVGTKGLKGVNAPTGTFSGGLGGTPGGGNGGAGQASSTAVGTGGGGGGYSSFSNLVIAAGGGGGGGGDNLEAPDGGDGGNGGLPNGLNGMSSNNSIGGTGATTTVGGTGGNLDGQNGSSLQGGRGGNGPSLGRAGGGGGGGGLFGGGGGGTGVGGGDSAGGGGGGSSLGQTFTGETRPSNVGIGGPKQNSIQSDGFDGFDGLVIVRYPLQSTIQNMYLGSTVIPRAYLGGTLVFGSQPFGAYELIADINVATATTQIDFDNLNITKDDELRLVYTLVGDTTSAFAAYSLRSNDITSNYTNQQLAAGGSSFFPSRVNDAVFSFARSNRRVSGFVDVKVSNNDRFVFQSQFILFLGSESSSIEQYNRNGVNTSTVTSITKLSVVSDRTNGIAVGSRLQLYKVNTGVA